jgi:membrane protein implicated in regulation of membrane protease activity
MALTTIWFAGGAFAAFFAALAGCTVRVQLVIFLVVSFLLLFLTRPVVTRLLKKNTVKTNVDELVGKKARVTVEINNNLSTGAAVVNGQEWTARAADDDCVIAAGEHVTIKEISGVKLIVVRSQSEENRS